MTSTLTIDMYHDKTQDQEEEDEYNFAEELELDEFGSGDSLNSPEVVERLLDIFSNDKTLNSTWEVMGQHKQYLSRFLQTHYTLLREGPLAAPLRHYLAIMAASRHSCTLLVENQKEEFLAAGGDPEWIEKGLDAAPQKIQRLSDLNMLLAHRPWALTAEHIQQLTHSSIPQAKWSLSELVYAIVLMSHFHSFSTFLESCVLMETEYKEKLDVQPQESPISNFNGSPSYDCTKPNNINSKVSPESDAFLPVVALVEKMETLRTQARAPDSEELSARFREVVELSGKTSGSVLSTSPAVTNNKAPAPASAKKATDTQNDPNKEKAVTGAEAPSELTRRQQLEFSRSLLSEELARYITKPEFQYVDYAQQRDKHKQFTTFRIQDYNWDDQCFSLVFRFYNDIAQLLDDKFRTTYNLTYRSMGSLQAVDTSMFRRATWNYIQCLFGIRWDDYDYTEVNVLLDRSLKKYIKTAACYPNLCSPQNYKSIMKDFLPSEKVHVCLIVSEAKFQSELLYALRAVETHYLSCMGGQR